MLLPGTLPGCRLGHDQPAVGLGLEQRDMVHCGPGGSGPVACVLPGRQVAAVRLQVILQQVVLETYAACHRLIVGVQRILARIGSWLG